MSSTRRAAVGSPLSYERYMSSSEFVDLRGVPGTAVAAKTQLYRNPRKRSLLFFIQSLSLKEGGLRGVVECVRKASASEALLRWDGNDLTRLLAEFCINPRLAIEFSEERSDSNRSGLPESLNEFCDALREFQRQYQRAAKSDFVKTSIGKEVLEALDHALAVGKMS